MFFLFNFLWFYMYFSYMFDYLIRMCLEKKFVKLLFIDLIVFVYEKFE